MELVFRGCCNNGSLTRHLGEMTSLFESMDKDGNGMLDEAGCGCKVRRMDLVAGCQG